MAATAAPTDVVDLEIDRPFLVSLYDRETGAVLFMGRVLDPSAS
jgi:serine protease inhibitor